MSREYPARPIIGVGTVVWHGDRVLLVQRGRPPRQGQWSLPGGAQQLGEIVGRGGAPRSSRGDRDHRRPRRRDRHGRIRSSATRRAGSAITTRSSISPPRRRPQHWSLATTRPMPAGSSPTRSEGWGCGRRRCGSSSSRERGGAADAGSGASLGGDAGRGTRLAGGAGRPHRAWRPSRDDRAGGQGRCRLRAGRRAHQSGGRQCLASLSPSTRARWQSASWCFLLLIAAKLRASSSSMRCCGISSWVRVAPPEPGSTSSKK